MNNIFEGAKFGDKFVTRDGKIALFDKKNNNGYYTLFLQDVYGNIGYKPDGTLCGNLPIEKTIVSRYQEPIDENKLDKLAKESKEFASRLASAPHVLKMLISYESGFKAGYRKAKEE